MDYHLDRTVKLNADPEHKGLYSWSLQEFGADNSIAMRDQIPWNWTLYFAANNLTLHDALAIRPNYRDNGDPEKSEVIEQQSISARLYPEKRRSIHAETSYQMFGANRDIEVFELIIEKLSDEREQEYCSAWGCVSYTTEIDFRDETMDDTVIFTLYVKPSTFARYVDKIKGASVHSAVFRVSNVSGFYSDWSPAISTSKIKILTNHKEHSVQIPDGCGIEPPRLDMIKDAEFRLQSMVELNENQLGDNEEEPFEEAQDLAAGHVYQTDSRSGAERISDLVSSLRTAAWIIAVLAFLNLFF